ncbi:hypothetical protein Tco_0925736 [Tanacetum coccineum]|uniref:Uncharacterized protein n=1 Tax=Tanacetum coccineum TaxID=301880 RepID=A0ABQ5D904_9ASTR
MSVSFKPADETNSAFHTFEVDRLAARELFVATLSCKEAAWSGGIIQVFAMLVAYAYPELCTFDGDILDLSYECFLPSQILEVGQKYRRIDWLWPCFLGKQDIVWKVGGKSILNIGSRMVGRRHQSVNNPTYARLEASLEMWRGFWRPQLKKGAQGGDVASLVAKERNRGSGETNFFCYGEQNKAQSNGQILHEDELAFFGDPRIAESQATQTVITHNVAYQADDLDACDSDYDELNTAKVALMANLSHWFRCSR